MTISIERYPIHATDKLRYADTDRQGHVNNACFATFLETGRVECLYNPSHPQADEKGYVNMPNVNVVEEMVNMISATRSYQTNVETMNAAKSLLLKTLTLGQ